MAAHKKKALMYGDTTGGDISGDIWSYTFEILNHEHQESTAFFNENYQSH